MKRIARLALWALLPLTIGWVAPASADDEEPPAPVGTQVAELDGVRVVERVIAGRALGAAVLPESLGHGLAVLLLPADSAGDEEDDPDDDTETSRQLWALYSDPSKPPQLLADDLPKEVSDLEIRLDADGRPAELWLGGDGVIYRFDPRSKTVGPILAAPGLDLGVLEQTGLLNCFSKSGVSVAIPELGRLRVLDSTLRETAVYPLPVTAERRTSGLVLSSPHVVRPRAGDMPFYIGPEAQGSTRLLVRVIEPGNADPKDADPREPIEAWIRLPSPEDVERSKFIVLDGIPRLAVTTTNAEKLGIFEEMGFRLYALRPDRTRGGVGPLLEVQTKTKHWYTVGIEVADLDGDGNDDLALIQPEGMGAGDLIVDVYLGLGDGRVRIAGHRRTKLDAPDATWHWGKDLSGDGVPDLFLASREKVELLPGNKDHRTRVLEKRAAWGWKPEELKAAMKRVDGEDGPTPSGHYTRLGKVSAQDFDGDGDMDLVLTKSQNGRVIVRFVIPR